MAWAIFAVPPVFEIAATISTFEVDGVASPIRCSIADVAPETASGGVEEQEMDAIAKYCSRGNTHGVLIFIQPSQAQWLCASIAQSGI